MGVSVPAAFAVVLIAALVSFGVLYVSSENAYSEIHGALEDYNRMVLKERTIRLELSGYSFATLSNVTVYDITFNITNAGSVTSPTRWAFIYDGVIAAPSVVSPRTEYLLPGEWANVTVLNVQKDPGVVHSLVVSTEVGCALKVKWEWVGNTTSGAPQVVSSAWYCPVEG
ncbi:hypothetical protein E3E36_01500 [Thermococcus sp. M36]|uniref:hypothetical protein n=1 Tax=Thermococcus sp. M36 TaxID=1638261 RepID=UPI00143BAFD4|nr:hypothetical protein [Thermococcus sp. M36]NJE04846.1 hypothetical protein [Thermococcus sp. M36]